MYRLTKVRIIGAGAKITIVRLKNPQPLAGGFDRRVFRKKEETSGAKG